MLHKPGERMREVHFPTTSLISLLTPVDGTSFLEVGLVGNEGMSGTSLILSVAASPLQAIVQGAGQSFSMDAVTFRGELKSGPALRLLLGRYLFVRLAQISRTAGCIKFHLVEARLARWLLMTQDRARSRKFHVTHEFLSVMLGVRRSGVTHAAT